eukprot:XP_017450637.1 PREDICTED: uncharacterized protein LOC102554207 isoform X2 [Rattus norvegicus]
MPFSASYLAGVMDPSSSCFSLHFIPDAATYFPLFLLDFKHVLSLARVDSTGLDPQEYRYYPHQENPIIIKSNQVPQTNAEYKISA